MKKTFLFHKSIKKKKKSEIIFVNAWSLFPKSFGKFVRLVKKGIFFEFV